MKLFTLYEYMAMASLLLLIAACGASNRVTSFFASAPTATATLRPTALPPPTATPLPTATNTPTPISAAATATSAPVLVATATPTTPAIPLKDLVDTARDVGTATIFLQVMDAAGLTAKLREPGPFTVFIPTDAAFAIIPQFIRDRILSNPDSNASQALFSLVVPGKVTTAMLTDGQQLQPLQGNPLQISRTADGNIMVNKTKIVMADIEASNGVIHFIDSLILPDNLPFGQ